MRRREKMDRTQKGEKEKRKTEEESAANEVKGGGGGGGPCGDSEVFSHSARSASVAVASSGTALLQDKD